MLFTMQRYEFFSKSQPVKMLGENDDGCCLPCKGTNFLANHNIWMTVGATHMMLFTMQRYEFFSKSQHATPISHILLDVVYHAKVRIF